MMRPANDTVLKMEGSSPLILPHRYKYFEEKRMTSTVNDTVLKMEGPSHLIHHHHLSSVHFGHALLDQVQDPAWCGNHHMNCC